MSDAPTLPELSVHESVYLDALTTMVQQCVERGAYGVLLLGLPDVPVLDLATALGGPSKVWVSLVGLTDQETVLAQASEQGWMPEQFGADADATHAVRVRNHPDVPAAAIRLVIAAEEVDRLHSLTERGYVRLGPDEAIQAIAEHGAKRARGVNLPQHNLWLALASKAVLPFLSLEGILDYYAAVFSRDDADPLETPRQELPLLGMLRDPQLFTGNIASEAAIQKRLLDNARMVERIRQADPDDRKKALGNLQAAPELERAYPALIRLGRGEEEAIKQLTLSEAQRLIVASPSSKTKAVREPTPEPGYEPPEGTSPPEPAAPTFDSPAEAALDWVIAGDTARLEELVEEVVEHLGQDERRERGTMRAEGAEIAFEPDERALALTRALVDAEVFGGTLRTDEPLDAVLANPGPHVERFERYDAVRMRTLRHYLERAASLLPDFEGLALLDEYLARRAVLTGIAADGVTHAQVLASRAAAFLYLIARPEVLEAAQVAIHAFERLLAHLEARFHELADRSTEGALRIYGEILALDLFIIRAAEEIGALVSPISPLALWKHVEIARVVRDRGGTLNEADRALLQAEVAEMPEPLLALYVPETANEEATELVYAERIGEIPVYRPSTLEAADVGADSLELTARKLAVLYPPVREDLHILLLNPRSLDPAAVAVRRLLQSKDPFRRVSLLVARTPDAHGGPIPLPSKLDELHAEGCVAVTLLPPLNLTDLARQLERHPVHVLAIAGEQQKNTGLVTKEGTRLHPLSVPRRLEADPITETLSLQPRSNRPTAEGVQHPYALYHDLVSALSRKPRSDRTAREYRRTTLHEYEALLPHCLFSIVAGVPEERGAEEVLRLSQGTGPFGDTVFTRYDQRIVDGFSELIRQRNYVPSADNIRELLRRIEEVGGEGVFSTISDAGPLGFSPTALQGQIGLAVALSWYREQAAEGQSVVVSLDSHLGRQWLGCRDDNHRTDLLGFRRTADGTLCIDVIEVKGYASTSETRVDESDAAQQLRAVTRVLNAMLERQGDLLLDRRRELLRLQVFREGLLDSRTVDAAWVRTLNEVLDGEQDVELNLLLVEVDLTANEPLRDESFDPEPNEGERVDPLPIRRVRLSEPSIRQYLGSLLPRSESAAPLFEQEAAPDPEAESPIADATPVAQEEAAIETPPTTSVDSAATAQPTVTPPAPQEPITVADLGFAPSAAEHEQIKAKARDIYRALEDLGVRVSGPVDSDLADVGPSIVRYKVRLSPGEKVSSLQSRARDLMRELAIEKEPIIDNLAGTNYVYVDLPRPERHFALLRPVLERAAEQGRPAAYSFPAGVTPDGVTEWLNVTELPHMLVAGSTNSGKSVFLYSLILGLTRLHKPAELELVLVDPKRTDFLFFSRLPHLHGRRLITDAEEAVTELRRLIDEEMEHRTQRLEEGMFRNIHSYNAKHPHASIRPIVVVIDEFADLADVLGTGERRADFDLALRRLAQRARSVGIHLVLATQRPTVDVVNGTLKANLPCRVSFRLGSSIDSRTILDEGGAENLLGAGDMLLKREGTTLRLQSFFVDEDTLRELVLGIMHR